MTGMASKLKLAGYRTHQGMPHSLIVAHSSQRYDAHSRPDPLQIVLTRAGLYGRGACADFTLKSADLIKTNPTEWSPTAVVLRQK